MNDHKYDQGHLTLITGASKGLGLTLARFLAARGSNLILNARHAQQLDQSLCSIPTQDNRLHAVVGDISDSQCRRQIRDLVRPYGGLNLIINNASTLGPTPMPYLSRYSLNDMRRVFEVNTFAPLALLQILQPYLSRECGTVINISSDASLGGYEGWGGYGASKAALDLISATLANELRDQKISVVSVDPGDMHTDMHQAAFPGEDISDRPQPEATVPFWAWLLGQEPSEISGRRFQAQSDFWQVLA